MESCAGKRVVDGHVYTHHMCNRSIYCKHHTSTLLNIINTQPILSSSYLGFGQSSLSNDTNEIVKLMDYLVCHHSAENFALVGHSTGCQNSIHLLKYGRKDAVERVKVCMFAKSPL